MCSCHELLNFLELLGMWCMWGWGVREKADECFEGLVSTDNVNPVSQPCSLNTCLLGRWEFSEPVLWASSPLEMLETLGLSPFTDIPFSGHTPPPAFFCFSLNHHLWACFQEMSHFSTLSWFSLRLAALRWYFWVYLSFNNKNSL